MNKYINNKYIGNRYIGCRLNAPCLPAILD